MIDRFNQALAALLVILLLVTGCGGSRVVAPPSNPFPAEAWVLEHSTNDPVASPALPWRSFTLHSIVTTNCLPIGVTNDGPYLQFQHAGSLWYYVNWTNKGPDGGTVEFTTRYLTQP